MKKNSHWFFPIFKLNRHYTGNEVSGFIILGIDFDNRPWYISKADEETKKDTWLLENFYDKNGWGTCWETQQEMEVGVAEDPNAIYKKVSIWQTTSFPKWLWSETILTAFVGMCIGILLTCLWLK